MDRFGRHSLSSRYRGQFGLSAAWRFIQSRGTRVLLGNEFRTNAALQQDVAKYDGDINEKQHYIVNTSRKIGSRYYISIRISSATTQINYCRASNLVLICDATFNDVFVKNCLISEQFHKLALHKLTSGNANCSSKFLLDRTDIARINYESEDIVSGQYLSPQHSFNIYLHNALFCKSCLVRCCVFLHLSHLLRRVLDDRQSPHKFHFPVEYWQRTSRISTQNKFNTEQGGSSWHISAMQEARNGSL